MNDEIKEILNAINLSLVLSYFLCNILFILIPGYDFKLVLIAETLIIPIMYLLVFVVCKLVGDTNVND